METATKHPTARLAWVLLGSVGLMTVIGVAVSVSIGERVDFLLFLVLSFPVVGALIASHQTRNAVGWIMLGIGFVVILSEVLGLYTDYALTISPGTLPGGGVALALEQHLWIPVIGLPGTFLILLFPDGHLPSPRWRPWAVFCAFVLILCYIVLSSLPGNFGESGFPDIRNPLGIEALSGIADAVVVIVALIPIAIVGCAVALVRRFRRSHGIARVQLKWLAAASGVVAGAYLCAMVLNLAFGDPDPQWLIVVGNVAVATFVLIPIAIGIAIFRHRLYDIDVIINRTLVYFGLTATLSAAYIIVVTTLQGVLRPVAGQSQLAVAGSTLVVAAIFRPARDRIQTLVDRRFYRSKFDAESTLANFSARLRDEVDLETLTADLLAVVDRTMKPARSSLWLRLPTGAVTETTPSQTDTDH